MHGKCLASDLHNLLYFKRFDRRPKVIMHLTGILSLRQQRDNLAISTFQVYLPNTVRLKNFSFINSYPYPCIYSKTGNFTGVQGYEVRVKPVKFRPT
jgi:hypothetical protein